MHSPYIYPDNPIPQASEDMIQLDPNILGAFSVLSLIRLALNLLNPANVRIHQIEKTSHQHDQATTPFPNLPQTPGIPFAMSKSPVSPYL